MSSNKYLSNLLQFNCKMQRVKLKQQSALSALSQRGTTALSCMFCTSSTRRPRISGVCEVHMNFPQAQMCCGPRVRKSDYPLCHFATSDVVKHRQGLWKLWGRDENFTTALSVIHCVFTGNVFTALSRRILRE